MARPTVIEQAQYKRLDEVAQVLGMNPATVVRHMHAGQLPLAKRNVNGVWLFTADWIEKARRQLAPKA